MKIRNYLILFPYSSCKSVLTQETLQRQEGNANLNKANGWRTKEDIIRRFLFKVLLCSLFRTL